MRGRINGAGEHGVFFFFIGNVIDSVNQKIDYSSIPTLSRIN